MVRVLQRAELTFEQYLLALFDSVMQIKRNVGNVRLYHLSVLHHGIEKLFFVYLGLIVKVFQQYVFLRANAADLFFKVLLIEKLLHLKTYLCVFIRVKRRYTALSRAEACLAEALFLILVEKHMIRHYYLRSVRNKQLRRGNSLLYHLIQLVKKHGYIQRYAVSYNIGSALRENARRQCMKRKFTIIIDNGMTCITSALETDDNVRLFCKHICDLAFSFVSPVSTYNCSNHT